MTTDLAVLVSGRGSNLKAILDAGLPVKLVVSNSSEAGGLRIARERGVETLVQPKPKDAGGRERRDGLLVDELRRRNVGLLALAGYNQILSDCLLEAFPNRIVNIHPSLLPAFAGGMAPAPQREALEYGVKVSGCTVHLVTAELDAGPILAQACVPVLAGDTVETLSQRILVEEHRLLPEVLRGLMGGRLALEGRRAAIWPEICRDNTRDTLAAKPL
jgi:phosphoribosylglycinamide formyltransferase 1